MLQCHGRVQGQYPVYLPADSLFTRKLVQRIHAETLHGGVSLTMAAICEEYWVPTLRQLVKSVGSACWGCKRFRALPLTAPPPEPLPTDRTHGRAAFEVIGIVCSLSYHQMTWICTPHTVQGGLLSTATANV